MSNDRNIVDGVDISECQLKERICKCTKLPDAVCRVYGWCSQNPDCDFKKLKRVLSDETQDKLLKYQKTVELIKSYSCKVRDIYMKELVDTEDHKNAVILSLGSFTRIISMCDSCLQATR